MLRNTRAQYGFVARLLHWTIAALIIVTMPIGLAMNRVGPGPLQNALYVTHESIGVSVFALALLRLAWRRLDPPPALPVGMPAWQGRAAVLNHRLLYGMLFLMPATGYLAVIGGGYPLNYFHLFDVPRLIDKHEAFGHTMETTHVVLQFAIYALVGAHVAAALHHHFVRRDGLLRRMWPGRASPAG